VGETSEGADQIGWDGGLGWTNAVGGAQAVAPIAAGEETEDVALDWLERHRQRDNGQAEGLHGSIHDDGDGGRCGR
jgi:hypothetical protein